MIPAVVVVVMMVIGAGAGQDVCVQQGPCSCVFPNGSAISLAELRLKAPSVRTIFEEVDKVSRERLIVEEYSVSLCKDTAHFNTSDATNCKNTSVCKKTIEMYKTNASSYNISVTKYDSLGSTAESTFGFTDSAPMVIFKKPPITTSVRLICIHSADVLVLVDDGDPTNNMLTLYSSSACTTAAVSRHSLGTTLLIVFFVMGIVYLGLGYAVKYFLMGARGAEAIPNYTFWKDFPNLVRDGILFIRNGFRPPAPSASTPNSNPNPNSYDSI